MIINIFLLAGILLFFAFAIYDQIGMDRLKGKTRLKVRLEKRAKSDALIFIGLILLFIYQTQSNINPSTLFLLAMLIILSIYAAFIRSPMLVLKENGFFYGNWYFTYATIHQINLAEKNLLVVDLKNGKRLLIQLTNEHDREQVVQFFGGYKS
ncbi:MAG: DUF986 family protein [[Pasteurella] mairii]|uniref:UPF0266 membrane protein NCTC10699_00410 n=1 Tax=[Pasteurella] mairii TaxID=757 RepID=A0A379B2T5_9PAST|nr:DUF986 family protein [[Pasteurella] mairii]SUB32821.1 membrane protein [[Pasteurella] mairii]